MTSIRIGNLRIRLASESQNLFNPSYAFGVQRLAPGSGGVLALRDAGSHDVLLPIDAEGNVIVRPGRDYELIRVMERHGAANTSNAASSKAAAPEKTATSAATATSERNGRKNKNKNSEKAVPAVNEEAVVTSTAAPVAAAEKPRGKRPREHAEHVEAAPVTAPAAPAAVAAPVAEAHKERKKHKSQSPHMTAEAAAPAPVSVATVKDDRTVAEIAATPSSHKSSPKSSPKVAATTTTTTTSTAVEANDLPLFMQFGGDDADDAPKKRGRKKKEQTQEAQVAPAAAAVSDAPRERSASPPNAAPVTLPPSTRGSTVRRPRPPLQDSSSDSD